MKKILPLIILISLVASAFGQEDKIYKSLSEVKDPSQVYHLKLSWKRLRKIPPCVFTYTNLRTLDLSNNNIDTIPGEITSLKNLQELDLGRNRIHVIPAHIGQLTNLKLLDLNRNPILDLPDEMSGLVNLEKLILWSTGVVSFPPSFVVLNYSLKLIDMRVCPMTYDNQVAIEELLPSPRKRWDHTCNCQ